MQLQIPRDAGPVLLCVRQANILLTIWPQVSARLALWTDSTMLCAKRHGQGWRGNRGAIGTSTGAWLQWIWLQPLGGMQPQI